MVRICYVIAAWPGPRKRYLWRPIEQIYMQDRTIFLRKHFEALGRWANDLTQILVMVPNCPHEPASYEPFLRSQNCSIQRRPNGNWAHGSYTDAFMLRLDDYDYWIMCEDDYSFTYPGFDRLLREACERRDLGYICGIILSQGEKKDLIRNGISIITRAALKKLFDRHGRFPGRCPQQLGPYLDGVGIKYDWWRERALITKIRNRMRKIPKASPVGITPLDWVIAAEHDVGIRQKMEGFGVPLW